METIEILPAYMDELKTQPNVKVLTHGADRITYEIGCAEGSGTVEVLTLFPGVVLQFHSFRCRSFSLGESKEMGNSLKINYCMEGRMEVMMSDHLFLFMEPGNLSIDTRKAADRFQFPCGRYEGVEFVFHSSALGGGTKDFLKTPELVKTPDFLKTPELLGTMGLSGKRVRERFCAEGQSYVVRAEERFRQLFREVCEAPPQCRIPYLRLKTAELLLLLCESEMPEKSDESSCMTMGQVQIAKQVMEIISSDLGRHYSIESLAQPFGISPSSLKNYFQGVYGKNISSWLREARMAAASRALKESNQTVAEIAAEVGYENASKFSAAFKNFLGETPLEYRRQSRCGM